MTFGSYLKQQRELKKYSQQEVAEKLFVTRQTISNWENGKSYPDIDRLIALSELYHVSLDTLIKGEDSTMSHTLSQNAKLARLQQRLLALLILANSSQLLWNRIGTPDMPINDFIEGLIIGISLASAALLIVSYRNPTWLIRRQCWWEK
ncbi:helix-turn-helix domain-containing protein [Aerococcaceae bacterium NML160702]|nr:helix-turn-helix domain-containing protein [Aerococcaceae bacterium NML180378]MCW6682734.1 helix-turn-helix domain-containing protein [Aerococcaceae bacterium NML160702]